MRKKVLGMSVFLLLICSTAMAMPFSWDLSQVGAVGGTTFAQVLSGNQTLNFNTLGVVSAPNSTSTIIQSLSGGANPLALDNGDTFSEFGLLNVVQLDSTALIFANEANYSLPKYAFVEFKDLSGYVTNYNAGLDGLATTSSNYATALLDDTFDLVFNPYAGSIKFYFGDSFDVTTATEIAELELLVGYGDSAVNKTTGIREGDFGLIAGFVDVLDDFWYLDNGMTFEDWMNLYGFPSIFATSFNIGATFQNIASVDGKLVFNAFNDGDFFITAVPEPSTFLLLGAGLLGLGFTIRRKK